MLRGVLGLSALMLVLIISTMIVMVFIGSHGRLSIAVAHIEPDSRLTYVDVYSRTRIDYPIRIRNLMDVWLIDGESGAFLLSQRGRRQEVINFALLYYADPLHGRLILLHSSRLAEEGQFIVRNLDDLSPTFSPDGKWLAFVDRDNHAIIVMDAERFDTDTAWSIPVANTNLAYGLHWSPNSEYIALKTGVDEISVIHRDGSLVRRFDGLQRGSYTPYWQDDNETLVIQYDFGFDTTLIVNWVNITSGQITTETWQVESYTPRLYWCGDTWLAHLDGQRIGKVRTINLKTLRRYQFESHERFASVSMESLLWREQCDGLILALHELSSNGTAEPLYSFVLSDPQASTILDLATQVLPYGIRLEGDLLSFQETDDNGSSTLSVLSVDRIQAGEIRQFDDLSHRDVIPSHWFDDGKRALYLIDGDRLALFEDGQVYPLIDNGENAVSVTLYQP